MSGTKIDALEYRRQLILISAMPYRMPPDGLVRANSLKILMHAMKCAGFWTPGMPDSLMDFGPAEIADHSFRLWYQTLIEMTREPVDGMKWLDGHGDLDHAAVHFTACLLTEHGRTLAEKILLEHPEWQPLQRY